MEFYTFTIKQLSSFSSSSSSEYKPSNDAVANARTKRREKKREFLRLYTHTQKETEKERIKKDEAEKLRFRSSRGSRPRTRRRSNRVAKEHHTRTRTNATTVRDGNRY